LADIPKWLQDQIAASGDGVVVNRCFSFTTPSDFLAKVFWERDRAIACIPGAQLDRIFHAMNFAVSAWHMHDWLWSFATDEVKQEWSKWFNSPIESARKFGEVLADTWPVLGACKEVANEVKHGQLHRPNPNISAIGERALHPGGEDWIPVIRIGDRRITDTEFYEEVLGVWATFLAHSGMLPGHLNEDVLMAASSAK